MRRPSSDASSTSYTPSGRLSLGRRTGEKATRTWRRRSAPVWGTGEGIELAIGSDSVGSTVVSEHDGDRRSAPASGSGNADVAPDLPPTVGLTPAQGDVAPAELGRAGAML